MIGDKLVITDYHRENGKKVANAIVEKIKASDRIFTLTIAGESGSGKSESAATTAKELEDRGFRAVILGQDDYFKLPPKSNQASRKEDIARVGLAEVHLDLMDKHLRMAKAGEETIVKPLVYFDEDRIGEERISLADIQVVIAEGTYTTTLAEADFHVFIDATYHVTLAHRKKRARDAVEGEFIEKILEIEHQIISRNKERANLILPPPQ